MALGKAGADRQSMHAVLRGHSLAAWETLRQGQPNPLVELVSSDPEIQHFLDVSQIRTLMEAGMYTGDAAKRALEMAVTIRSALK